MLFRIILRRNSPKSKRYEVNKMAQKESEMVQSFDIATFLWHFRSFSVLTNPFIKIVTFWFDVIRWKNPKVSFVIWLSINFFSAAISSEYAFVICLMAVFILAILGIFHHFSQVFIKFFPDQDLETNALQSYLQRNWGERQKILDEYRCVLVKIDTFLANVNSVFEKIYKIFKWENPRNSFQWFAGATGLLTACFLLDPHWVVFLLNNSSPILIIWMATNKLPAEEHSNKEQLPPCRSPPVIVTSDTINKEPVIQEEEVKDNVSGQVEEPLDSDLEDTEDTEDVESIESTETKSVEEQSPSRTKTNVVRKLIDLRRRHVQANTGTCAGCQATFSSILKRKYDCSNCANHFCSKCCSIKVPKSFLGVTAPATRNDMVLVCFSCHRFLTGQGAT